MSKYKSEALRETAAETELTQVQKATLYASADHLDKLEGLVIALESARRTAVQYAENIEREYMVEELMADVEEMEEDDGEEMA